MLLEDFIYLSGSYNIIPTYLSAFVYVIHIFYIIDIVHIFYFHNIIYAIYFLYIP